MLIRVVTLANLINKVNCKLCSGKELTEQLDCKSMEIKWYIYMKVDRVYDSFQPYTRYTRCTKVVLMQPRRLQPCISA